MPNANDSCIVFNGKRIVKMKTEYRCKSCNQKAFEVLRNTFMCRTPGCVRNDGNAESALFGLPDWVEEVSDAKSE